MRPFLDRTRLWIEIPIPNDRPRLLADRSWALLHCRVSRTRARKHTPILIPISALFPVPERDQTCFPSLRRLDERH